MSRLDINAVRCEALFASALQPSDHPGLDDVREAISATVRHLGSRGCACRVAQEFGDDPEMAARRMRWARALVRSSLRGRRRASDPGNRSTCAWEPERVHRAA